MEKYSMLINAYNLFVLLRLAIKNQPKNHSLYLKFSGKASQSFSKRNELRPVCKLIKNEKCLTNHSWLPQGYSKALSIVFPASICTAQKSLISYRKTKVL